MATTTTEKLTIEKMEYMVWVVEVAAKAFFCGDKTTTYETMISSGLWDIYIDNYETTHSLGMEYLLAEMKEYFNVNGVIIP
ncbi:MAG: hypothetical protein FWE05_11855 [Defluviitaleaceae bacterium]|nr:hypothetical protein [Defluviitaleaceae bacterium]